MFSAPPSSRLAPPPVVLFPVQVQSDEDQQEREQAPALEQKPYREPGPADQTVKTD